MQLASAKEFHFMHGRWPDSLQKPIVKLDGTYDTYKLTLDKDIHFRGESFMQTIEKSMFADTKAQLNQPGLLYALNHINKSGGTMPAQEVTFGRLVRIPGYSAHIDARYQDVTVKDAKREAKRLKKLARQIEKACR